MKNLTTYADKIRALKEIRVKLVLVQQQELERISIGKSKCGAFRPYIEQLYNYYIVNKLSKYDYQIHL